MKRRCPKPPRGLHWLIVGHPGTAGIIKGRGSVHSLVRKLAIPFLSAQPQQDGDNLPLTLSLSGPDA